MTTEEFWEKYTNKEILEIYEDTKHFFSQKLPADFLEDYEYGEVILEIKAHLETAKEFEKVLDFTNILQAKHTEIYQEYHYCFDRFLIDYYCFHNQIDMLTQPVENYFNDPVQGIDNLLFSFRKLLYYQHIDLVDSLIIQTYQKIHNSPELMGNAGYDLAIAKFYIELEKRYQDFLQTGNFVWENFITILKRFHFNFAPDFLPSLEKGLTADRLSVEELKEYPKKDTETVLMIIEGYFLKSMMKKGFSFFLSGKIWDVMLKFWTNPKEKKNRVRELEDSFLIEYDAFYEFLDQTAGSIFLDKSMDIAAIIWGGQYIYDFLKETGLITENAYTKALDILNIRKARLMIKRLPDLWNFNFIHHWGKADSISQAEFDAEHNIFTKSYSFKPVGWKQEPFKKYGKEIDEEINQMTILKPFILEPDVYEKKYKKIPKEQKEISYYVPKVPYVSSPKVGRNEPCPCGSGKKYKKCCGK